MAEEIYEKEKEEEMKENELILENKRFIGKYGLTKKELETVMKGHLKFKGSFRVVAEHLQSAINSIQYRNERECMYLIERAKYVLKGCKE